MECNVLTLGILFPFNEGYFLISDRQNTFGHGHKNKITKIYVQGVNGPAISFAGSSALIRKIIGEVYSSTLTNDNVKDVLKKIREKAFAETITELSMRKVGPKSKDLHLEMFVIIFGENLEFYRLQEGHLIRITDLTKIYIIPEDTPSMRLYQELDTSSLSEDLAIQTGEELLRQASFSNYYIGPPDYHGYDYVKITNDGRFLMQKIEPSCDEVGAADLLGYVSKKNKKRRRKVEWLSKKLKKCVKD